MFSDTAIRNAQPRERPFKVFDEGKSAARGLFVLIKPKTSRKPTGSKLWRLRYWHGGKEKLLALGEFPTVPLAEARRRAESARRSLEQDVDPVHAKRLASQERARRVESRFGALAERWLDAGAWVAATEKQYRRLVDRYLIPALGTLDASQVTRDDVNRVIATAAKKKVDKDKDGRRKTIGGVIAARTLRLVLAGILDQAVDAGKLDANPALLRRSRTRTKRKTETHKPKPYRHLDADGLAKFLRRLDAYAGSPETIAALKLLVLNFTRPSELRCARWEEFNLDAVGGAIWNIPADRMKAREPHDVPLSAQAVAVLRKLQSIAPARELLFPNIRDAGKPMGPSTLLRALGYLGVDGSPHGFRHAASTILHEHGFDTLVIERQLAHADRNAVRRRYNLATFLPERRRMLQHWADFLDRIKDGADESNVIVMSRSAAS